ncbi:hypothetical protein DFA_07263 [Cavenderia fasciculata]|uniref:TIGR01777 family protein n=1 Tax=Cavenderia fasciculata TaxID=261658 RepID=F4PVX9_CACFS|nr:uncharacterized protein DFA_07263 [Cavenderia fasciculata]EGG20143.1 hypothetical protein DFA_07263 [Cavenderia fasciculata]|eukprot:XP_004367126.1 hypothetical protein DFA_07263 [Cavenderia fasciculata]
MSGQRILVTGATGFLGKSISKSFANRGHQVFKMVRTPPKSDNEISWNPATNQIDTKTLNDVSPNVVIHLAGENIVGLWTEDKKKRIFESRKKGTELLANALNKIDNPPGVFIGASGCSYYGDKLAQPTDESAPKGTGFFQDLVQVWESSCDPLRNNGKTRVSHMRLGLVMDSDGGFLQQVKLPFSLGLGGRIGSGNQYFPWISLKEVKNIVRFLMENDQCSGAFNATSPQLITNLELTRAIGKVLNRPTIFPLPELLLNTILGKEMSSATFLADQPIVPTRLQKAGYQFIDSSIEKVLERELK